MSASIVTRPDAAAQVQSAQRRRRSAWPARLDLAQSVSGLILGLFMWGHMMFVSSILLGKDAMWVITKMFEGYFIFGRAHPVIVSVVVGTVFALFIAHAALALRKFPINVAQWIAYRRHMGTMHHEDTTLWSWQVITGFALFFLASAHLMQMLLFPGLIGPHESAARVWHGWWPIYLVLLFAVEIHGGVGLYRLAVKWGWFEGSDPKATRARLKQLKWGLSIFFIVLGLATLAAYLKIGYELRAQDAPRYTPAWLTNPPQAAPPSWWPSRLAPEGRP
jgi:fumarate reductase subunit C